MNNTVILDERGEEQFQAVLPESVILNNKPFKHEGAIVDIIDAIWDSEHRRWEVTVKVRRNKDDRKGGPKKAATRNPGKRPKARDTLPEV